MVMAISCLWDNICRNGRLTTIYSQTWKGLTTMHTSPTKPSLLTVSRKWNPWDLLYKRTMAVKANKDVMIPPAIRIFQQPIGYHVRFTSSDLPVIRCQPFASRLSLMTIVNCCRLLGQKVQYHQMSLLAPVLPTCTSLRNWSVPFWRAFWADPSPISKKLLSIFPSRLEVPHNFCLLNLQLKNFHLIRKHFASMPKR